MYTVHYGAVPGGEGVRGDVGCRRAALGPQQIIASAAAAAAASRRGPPLLVDRLWSIFILLKIPLI